MAEIMTVWGWSPADFDRIETVEDLLDWHGRAVSLFNKTNGVKEGVRP